MKIYQFSPTEANNDTINDIRLSGANYFADTCLRVQQYMGSLEIVDLSNAMKTGKTCVSVKFCRDLCGPSDSLAVTRLISAYNCNYKLLFDNLLEFGADAPKNGRGIRVELEGIEGNLYVSEEKAVRVYSPFAKVPALKEEPKKWTVAHVVKALLNGQFKNLECEGKYSDDYAFDAAYNFLKGEHEDRGRHLIEKLVTRPDGWWINTGNPGGNYVGVNCHQFEYHGFEFCLVPPTKEERKEVAEKMAA